MSFASRRRAVIAASRAFVQIAVAACLVACGGGNTIPAEPAGTWSKVQEPAPWGTRDAGATAMHNGALWMLGGWTYENGQARVLVDTWMSADGRDWQQVATPWSFGMYPMAASFKQQLFYMGGLKNSRLPDEAIGNEIWSSVDGISWALRTSRSAWEPRIGATLVEHAGALWILGGKVANTGDPAAFRRDVWRSTDGVAWFLVTNEAPWAARAFHCAVSFQGRIWVIGGGDWDSRVARADVWSSADGLNWQLHSTPPWQGRIWHGCLADGERIWLIGGRLFDPIRTVDEIWTTLDGDSWTASAAPVRPGARHAAYLALRSDGLWVMGGSADGYLPSDVWHFSAR